MRIEILLVLLSLFLAVSCSCPNSTLPLDCCAVDICPPGFVPQLWDFASVDGSNFEKLWDMSVAPTPDYFRKRTFDGLILKVEDGAIGKTVVELLIGDITSEDTLQSKDISFKKVFNAADDPQGRSGETFWPCKKEWMSFKIYTSPAIEGSGDSLKIDYKVYGNSELVQPLVDEVRVFSKDSNVIIGRNFYRTALGTLKTLWFTLQLRDN